MADSEQYDASASNSLAAKNENTTDKVASDQKAAQDKGKSAAQGLVASRKQAKAAKPAASSTAAPSAGAMGAVKSALSGGGGGLVGAVKNKIDPMKPAAPAATPTTSAMFPGGAVQGGKDLISADSMKGQNLTQDPKANLASKGRFSDYRKTFLARGAAGKHSWGGK